MLIPQIQESTVQNLCNEFMREGMGEYLKNKVDILADSNPHLFISICSLADNLFVIHDDSPSEDKMVNKMRAIALTLVAINLINTEMEIEWLKQ